MFSHSTTQQRIAAATTVAWSEVRVGDRVRPIKIVGLPVRARRWPARSLETATPTFGSQSQHDRKDA